MLNLSFSFSLPTPTELILANATFGYPNRFLRMESHPYFGIPRWNVNYFTFFFSFFFNIPTTLILYETMEMADGGKWEVSHTEKSRKKKTNKEGFYSKA